MYMNEEAAEDECDYNAESIERGRKIISALSRQNLRNPSLRHLNYQDETPCLKCFLEYPIPSLETLYIEGGELKYLKPLLANNRVLTFVDLNAPVNDYDCPHDDLTELEAASINDFLEALESNHSLTTLTIDNLEFEAKEHWERFKKALEQNRTLTWLTGDEFKFSSEEEAQLDSILLRNRVSMHRTRYNWARASATMAFIRANSASPLRTSVFPLLDDIARSAGCETPALEDRINVDAFLSTRFALHCLNAPPLAAMSSNSSSSAAATLSRKRPLL